MRWIRFLVCSGAGLLVLYVGLTIWINHSGSHAWRSAQERLAREGVVLDLAAVKVAPIPASDNFCDIPLLAGINQFVDGDEAQGEPAAKRKAVEALGPPPLVDGFSRPWITNKNNEAAPLDLKEWSRWLRDGGHPMPVNDPSNPAREVLAALSYQDKAVAEMAAAADRPMARLQPDWTKEPLPELLVTRSTATLTTLQNLSMGLTLRAKAAAQAGDVARAHEAALILVRVTEATLEEPFALGLLVGITSAAQLSNVVRELAYFHCGSAEDFSRLRRAMERVNLRLATVQAFKEEIAVFVNASFYMDKHRMEATPWLDDRELKSALQWTGWLIPKGWFESNAAAISNMTLDYVVLPVRDRSWADVMVSQRQMEDHLMRARKKWWRNTDQWMALLAMPTYTRIVERTVYGQCLWDQAIIACALEQYHKEHAGYPERLSDLAPLVTRALPLDTFSARPMGYRTTPEGRYVLWGVGFDGVDDNGYRPKEKGGRNRPSNRDYKGDWVLEFAEPGEEDPQDEKPKPLKRWRGKRPPLSGAEQSTPSGS
ncbi:hypothetical protein DES53_12511 [Roseimicrobium gellanilyticum]|uniref:Uncharacterized protein n=1 Tax=Roseimicrobium gellanilyticum TaxID=748857 RepID=A0A366H329_9BACT|nr:hypothetical protein [Roseimicrobium gellanilyticum]RBP35185.1 hypothetical protein DES53_12511 [Roseimicrobium gellanilyticum]